ncbi:UNVERIFIED_CONTAM: hypothetical protein H355_002853 [Colinus virginianus]|nr:hypothetical protein H355_002853 [Colinus virginianus]
MGRMWPCGVLLLPLLLRLGSSGAATTGVEGSVPPGLDGSVPPGLDGSVPPGLEGSVPPGLDGSVPPGLGGSVPLGLGGSVPPGLGGSVPPGSDASITPKLDGPTTPKRNVSFPPLPPRPSSYLDAVVAAVRLLNQRIPAPCTLRLRAAQPRPRWTLQHCVGTVSVEQQPTAELRCAPLWVQPIRSWWGRVRKWWDGLRERLRQRLPFRVRGHLNITSAPRP